ncbi:protein translocase subunit SecF [Salipaludibacillus agaradhaerens]|uniref:Protein-export membrane protein SecF n=1 Tax=Salipaludibacillus agaradhaerens TaxID=76935 RepID=A0A9Q4FZ36_SALAG|nr:protein translocase subunit SecF [Salipaludibacillus agaradhaerens]MCR6096976.1 protein translocase subunit SecF [Salipaludibacillus agaradhaerens]MCR6113539.1 protein translocase subunit SecF [Salipaludibacillus agaradhaerens]
MNFEHWNTKLDFVKHRKKFFALSIAILLLGIIMLSTVGLNLGIDFRSGTTIDIMAEDTITADEIRGHFEEVGYTPDDVTLAGEDNNIGRASFIGGLDQQETLEIQNHFDDVYGSMPNVSTVTPLVGEELARNAIISVLIATVGIIIYVTIRFEFLYGLSAIVALFHDALFIVGVFSIVQMEVNIPFIAAVLTIIGYSINDTIVTFDRIRENMTYEKKVKGFDDLARVVNKSLVQTLARSLNTVLTVFFAAAALFFLGGDALRTFSLALVVGLIAGTYSSLFIAAQLWLVLKARQLKKGRRRVKQSEREQQPET